MRHDEELCDTSHKRCACACAGRVEVEVECTKTARVHVYSLSCTQLILINSVQHKNLSFVALSVETRQQVSKTRLPLSLHQVYRKNPVHSSKKRKKRPSVGPRARRE